MNTEAQRSYAKSQVRKVVVGVVLAAAALWGAWFISAGGGDGRDAAQGDGANSALRVDVSGVRDDRGNIVGTLCREGEPFPSGCTLEARAKASQGVVSLDFKGLTKGNYALALYHDENDNSVLELGTEGIGFSNNANLVKAPPNFDASRIKVDGATRIRVRIRYSI